MRNLSGAELEQVIAQGESSAVEFKQEDTRPENLAREMVAFANAQGGLIVLGVADDGSITGVDPLHKHTERLVNIARNNCVPPLDITCWTGIIQERTVVCASVPKGPHKPYQTQDGRYLIRVDATSRQASGPELLRLFQASGMFHFDLTAVEGSAERHLDAARLADYFKAYRLAFDELPAEERSALLRNTDILTDQGACTLAGMLLFGINPGRFVDQAAISFAIYAEDHPGAELYDRQVFTGTLPNQIDAAVAALRRAVPDPSRIVGSQRQSTGLVYPEVVFRELVVNAVAHRNYAIAGSRVRLQVYPSKIVIESPGRLPNTVHIEKLKAGVSFAVNPVIVKFLENLGYIDRLGRGLPMVWRSGLDLGVEIDFAEIGEAFRVTLPLEAPTR